MKQVINTILGRTKVNGGKTHRRKRNNQNELTNELDHLSNELDHLTLALFTIASTSKYS